MFRGKQTCRAAALQRIVWMIQMVALMAAALASQSSHALTAYSRQILELQHTFGQASSHHPIIYLDRDILSPINKTNEKDDPKIKALHISLMQEFIQERIHISVDDVNADILADFFRVGANVALPITLADKKTKICAIVPADPNLNARQEAERLLGWQKLKGTPEYSHHEIAHFLSKEDSMLLSNIHETFHCLDQTYLAQREQSGLADDLMFHKSETFAEIGALLYLASHKNLRSLARIRADFRTVGSFMSGRHATLLGPQIDTLAWGAIYSFSRAIMATDSLIHEIQPGLTLNENIEMANHIVEQYSLRAVEIFAIDRYQKDPDGQAELIEKFTAEDGPLAERFRAVQIARQAYEQTLAESFARLLNPVPTPPQTPMLDTQIEMRVSAMNCPKSKNSNDKKMLEIQIDEVRSLHYAYDLVQPSIFYNKLNELTGCFWG